MYANQLGIEPTTTVAIVSTIVKAVPFFAGLFGKKKAKPPRAHAGFVLKQGVPPTVGNVLKAIRTVVTPWQNFQKPGPAGAGIFFIGPPPRNGGFMIASGGFKGHERITMDFIPEVQAALGKVNQDFDRYFASLPFGVKNQILRANTNFTIGGHGLDFMQQIAFIPGWDGYELSSDGEIGAIVTTAINRLSTVINNVSQDVVVATPASQIQFQLPSTTSRITPTVITAGQPLSTQGIINFLLPGPTLFSKENTPFLIGVGAIALAAIFSD